MSQPALAFRHVSKRFKKTIALNDVSFEVAAGECFALAGVNGAGKTTLIKSLIDLSEIDSGDIEIAGVNHRHTRSRSPLAYLPERFNPPYYLSGREFLSFMGELNGRTPTTMEVQGMLRALDLDFAVLAKPARQLSKGMTQKLGLACCLLSDKQIYILDEPLSGLDPRARSLVKDQLKRLKTRRKTLFFTSHALPDIEELCDRMAVLHDGSLRFVGTPRALVAGYGAGNLDQAFLRCIG